MNSRDFARLKWENGAHMDLSTLSFRHDGMRTHGTMWQSSGT